jgi:hypothetical protein
MTDIDDATYRQAIETYIDHSQAAGFGNEWLCIGCEQPAPCPQLLWAHQILGLPPPPPGKRR